MVYVVCGIRVTKKDIRKQIKPEKRVEKPKYCEDTGKMIGTKTVVVEKAKFEYKFEGWSNTNFEKLIFKLRFAPFSNDLYIYENDDEFYIGECLSYSPFYEPHLLDMEKYNNCIKLVAKHFPHYEMGLWIYEKRNKD